MTRTRLVIGALLAGAAVVLTACTGVPHTSTPEIVTAVAAEGQPSEPAANTPQPGAAPRTIVQDFLSASELPTPRSGAGVPDRATRTDAGTDSTVDDRWRTSVSATSQTGTDPGQRTAGRHDRRHRRVHTGSAGQRQRRGRQPVRHRYHRAARGVRAGLAHRQHPERVARRFRGLPADVHAARAVLLRPRPSSGSSPTRDSRRYLRPCAARELAGHPAGRRPAARTAQPSTTELPAQARPRPPRSTVTLGSPARCTLPGAAQLQGATRLRLATMVAYTSLPGRVGDNDLTIVDARRPVSIPGVGTRGSPRRSSAPRSRPPMTPPTLYYLVDGRHRRRRREADRPLRSAYAFYGFRRAGRQRAAPTCASPGVRRRRNTRGCSSARSTAACSETTLRGPMSRPAWAPAATRCGSATGKHRCSASTCTAGPTEVQLSAAMGRCAARCRPFGSARRGAGSRWSSPAQDGSPDLGRVGRAQPASQQVARRRPRAHQPAGRRRSPTSRGTTR